MNDTTERIQTPFGEMVIRALSEGRVFIETFRGYIEGKNVRESITINTVEYGLTARFEPVPDGSGKYQLEGTEYGKRDNNLYLYHHTYHAVHGTRMDSFGVDITDSAKKKATAALLPIAEKWASENKEKVQEAIYNDLIWKYNRKQEDIEKKEREIEAMKVEAEEMLFAVNAAEKKLKAIA